ncbi:MAG: LacI family DNA-binding transcriptional regulator [Phycisphaerae bacterium]
MTTMGQVAKEAGVSRYTVSKVLNGTYVAEKTRKKVLEACEKLHYTRNLLATGLVRNESFTIGMLISQNFDSFFGEIINAAEKEAYNNGYQLICQCSLGDIEEEARILRNFESLRVCGVIVAPVVDKCSLEDWASLEKRMPVVYFDCYLSGDSSFVINDNYLSARLVTEHLIEQGTSPAYLGSVHPDTNLAVKTRRRSYIETMEARGKKPVLIPTTSSAETVDNQAFGYDNLTAFLENNEMPDAIFCATDRIAMGAIYALQERGIVVGRDILIAGHDNLQFGAYMNPTLTTVTQPKQEMGTECVKSLLTLLKNRGERIQKVLTPELIIRRSTVNS